MIYAIIYSRVYVIINVLKFFGILFLLEKIVHYCNGPSILCLYKILVLYLEFKDDYRNLCCL